MDVANNKNFSDTGEDATPRTPLSGRELMYAIDPYGHASPTEDLANEIVRCLISAGHVNGTTEDFAEVEKVVRAALRAATPERTGQP